MNIFNDISDEMLACYLDGNCSDAEMKQVEEAISTVEDLNTLLLSRLVMHKMEEEINGLPSFEESKIVEFEPFVNLRAAGFLGDQGTADLSSENEMNTKDDRQDE